MWVGAYPGNGPELAAKAKAAQVDRVIRVAQQHWHEFDVGIDSGLPLTDGRADAFERASDAVADCLRRGECVLVTCQAGINRSALVAGLALVKAYGYSGALALSEIRANRRNTTHVALCNGVFADYLVESAPETRGAGMLRRLRANIREWANAR